MMDEIQRWFLKDFAKINNIYGIKQSGSQFRSPAITVWLILSQLSVVRYVLQSNLRWSDMMGNGFITDQEQEQ